MCPVTGDSSGMRVEFCDEWFDVDASRPFSIGREGDLVVDDNPYLHRRFLEISRRDGLWWLANVGRQLAATLADDDGRFEAWLAPEAHLPIVFDRLTVRFSAGPTTYSLTIHLTAPPFVATPLSPREASATTTVGRLLLEGEHRMLVLALAEPILRSPGQGRTSLPTSAAAAARLGWPLTKFNRKLDHVCSKLQKAGVHGLHGDLSSLASDRRARLVEYALASRLVGTEDLCILDEGAHPIAAP